MWKFIAKLNVLTLFANLLGIFFFAIFIEFIFYKQKSIIKQDKMWKFIAKLNVLTLFANLFP